MAQNATININAVDNTRGAFLAVQRNMEQVRQTAKKTGEGLMSSLSGRGLGTALGAALGINLRSISEHIARAITGVTKETEAALERIVAATGRLADAQERRLDRISTDEDRINRLRLSEANRLREIQELTDKLGTTEKRRVLVGKGRAVEVDAPLRNQLEINAKIVELNAELEELAERRSAIESRVATSAKSVREEHEKLMRAAGTGNAPLKLMEQIDALREAEGRIMSELEKHDPNTTAGQKAQIPLLKEQVEIKEKLEELDHRRTKASREASKILAEGFEEAVFSGKKLSEVIKQLGADLMRLVFRNMITNPLADGITKGLQGLKFFASGGIPPTGRASIVGEKGPELFVPGTSGRIVPNHELGGNSGGGATYYIDARGADQTGLARLEGMIRETRASIKPIALASVIDARMRGGAMARAA